MGLAATGWARVDVAIELMVRMGALTASCRLPRQDLYPTNKQADWLDCQSRPYLFYTAVTLKAFYTAQSSVSQCWDQGILVFIELLFFFGAQTLVTQLFYRRDLCLDKATPNKAREGIKIRKKLQ